MNRTCSAAEARDGRRRDDALLGVPDSHHDVDARLRKGRGDRRSELAGLEKLYPRSRPPHFVDELAMPLAIENRNGQVFDVDSFGVRDADEVIEHRRVEIDRVRRLGPDHQLPHIRSDERGERPLLSHGDRRDRIRLPVGERFDAIDRVENKVERRLAAGADRVPDAQLRALAYSLLADYDMARYLDTLEGELHRLDGSAIRARRLPLPEETCGCEGSGFRYPHELQGEVAIQAGFPPDVCVMARTYRTARPRGMRFPPRACVPDPGQ